MLSGTDQPSSPDNRLEGIPRPGDVIADKFRIEEELGVGGMGVVLAAKHIHLDARVAIKFLLPDTMKDQKAVVRFQREARAAARLRSEHVARIIDVSALDSGLPYVVMEYLVGTDLHALVREHGPLAVSEAVDYVLQACLAIAEAHALGIVHRDLKPANLFLTHKPDGSPLVKVLDFGLAKTTQVEGSITGDSGSLSRSQSIIGSPQFMAPEQIRKPALVDARSDIWALGACLYELLSGRPPFEAETVVELLATVLTEPPVPLRERRPLVPPGLEKVVMDCLHRQVTRRVQDVGMLAQLLEPFASSDSAALVEQIVRMAATVTVRQAMPGMVQFSPSGLGAVPTTTVITNYVRRRWGRMLALVVAALLVAGVSAALLLRARGPRTRGGPPDLAAGVPAHLVTPPATTPAARRDAAVLGAAAPDAATSGAAAHGAAAAPPQATRPPVSAPERKAKPRPAKKAVDPLGSRE